MTTSRGTWPPIPPEPPEPPRPRRTPWLPDPRPSAPASASASVVVGAPDWLAERLVDQRVVALAGELDADVANRAVAELGLLDASGDAPVDLRLAGVSADLDVALTLLDALDLMGAPVHATCLGTLTGPAIALIAVADSRIAGPHAMFQLTEPREPYAFPLREVQSRAAERAVSLRLLQERLAEACGRPVEQIAADMRAGRLLSASGARAYGLVDEVGPPRRRPAPSPDAG
jgi:ATP-dependent Clp protease, protease subunit